MDKEQLLTLKGTIETAKTEVAKATGRLEALRAQLKKEHNCSTVADAEKKIITLNKKIKTLNETIEKDAESLLEKFKAIEEEKEDDDEDT